ncbi:hypothetical protein TorRG33x02_301140 [Trema orientale]|uniref:Uncharacterized protein n=1 Tax=Trema orientale TaxID=63057 RepID=A0A2P5C1I2_TREOI|nr:hypothetical protein TorRG33x02_301140 [Trema orientale]
MGVSWLLMCYLVKESGKLMVCFLVELLVSLLLIKAVDYLWLKLMERTLRWTQTLEPMQQGSELKKKTNIYYSFIKWLVIMHLMFYPKYSVSFLTSCHSFDVSDERVLAVFNGKLCIFYLDKGTKILKCPNKLVSFLKALM